METREICWRAHFVLYFTIFILSHKIICQEEEEIILRTPHRVVILADKQFWRVKSICLYRRIEGVFCLSCLERNAWKNENNNLQLEFVYFAWIIYVADPIGDGEEEMVAECEVDLWWMGNSVFELSFYWFSTLPTYPDPGHWNLSWTVPRRTTDGSYSPRT